MKKKTAAGVAVRELISKGTEAVNSVKAGDSEKLRKILARAGLFLVTCIVGGTMCTEGIYPFGIAILCTAEGTFNTGLAFSGAMLSTLGMRENAFWHILAVILAFAARLCANAVCGAFFEKNSIKRKLFRESPYIRLAISAGCAAVLGGVGILRGESLYYSIYQTLAGVLIYSVITAAFMMILSDGSDIQRGSPGSLYRVLSPKTAGVCAAAFAAVLTLKSIALPFSIATVAAYFLTVWFAYSGGTAMGFAVGISCGIALGGTVGPALSLTGGVAGMLFEYGDSLAVIVSSLCGGLLSAVTGGISAFVEFVPETVFAAAIIIPLIKLNILPKDLTDKLYGAGNSVPFPIKANAENGAVKERCKKISDSLESLSKLLISVGNKMRCPTPQEAYRICTAARARYCGGCEFESLCSGDEEKEVNSFFSNMSHSLSLRGKVTARIVPERLARRCYNMDSLIRAVNTSAERLAGLSAAGAKTELLASDYTAIASLLRETALSESDWQPDSGASVLLKRSMRANGFDFSGASVYGKRRKKVYMYGVNCDGCTAGERDIRRCAEETLGTRLSPVEFSIDKKTVSASMHTVPAFSVKCGKFTGIGERDTASGDSVVSFENDEGMFYSLVSDGMGSGREAAVTSGLSALFLEKLLSAGCPMKSALELLNCFVRGNEGECFTTVDLMEADLITGRARFIKSGAAPSFVLRGGQLFRLHSKTVPVGIMRALDAEAISFDLQDDDTVIMMSDGVTGNYEDCPWLYELLCDGLKREDSPSRMAKMIGEAAVENTGREDDITVCVMKISKT
ncbi:MAG: SpoIIE family protein phosphatase [Clostridia bacterium]|nr:SpoIIE family protein phosphatase [Clostridia bacterium]